MAVSVATHFQSDPDAAGRYEYRVWPHTMNVPAVAKLQSSWLLAGAESRSDIYLVSARSHWTMVKLRSGTRLEIKLREADLAGGLQYWTCPVSSAFPLAPDVRHQLASVIGLPGGIPSEAGLSPAHLLAAVETAMSGILPVPVRKSRLLFENGTCRAEICRATILQHSRLTLSVEDAKASRASIAVQELQLGDMRNVSYGDMLISRLLPVR